MIKVLQARLQEYMNCEIPDNQAGFRKGRGTKYQIAIIHWIIKEAMEFQKNIYFCFIDYPQSLWLYIKKKKKKKKTCGKFFKREYQTTLSASWEICIQIKMK